MKLLNHYFRFLPLVFLPALLILLLACDPFPSPTPNSTGGNNPNFNPINTRPGFNNSNGNFTPDQRPPGGGSGNSAASNPGGGLPQLSTKPRPVSGDFMGCPARGDGGDGDLNVLKNRTDQANWYPVSISSLLSLQWPPGIQQKKRALWSGQETSEINRYEGVPVQVEGWLAGAKQEGPESPNCHAQDEVDNHLWIVDAPNKDRSQAVVVEITPRLRAVHPGWAFERIMPLVDGKTKIRISGWLMLDQEHPDQVGKTRGTIWEIHPIVSIEVQRGNNWVSIDNGRPSNSNSNPAAVPTLAPLPPDIQEAPDEAAIPTATSRPVTNKSGGRETASGPVRISDIVFKGASGTQSEPDEYVEITNTGSSPVNMDGWVLHDLYGNQEFTWHNFTIKAGQKIRLYTNQIHPESGGFSFGSSQAIWRNKGDAAELLDANSTVVSSFAYGDKR